ncbi:MAG: hypothetical protein ACREXT_18435 [Gammaproteobacteria bacterium]
MSDRAAAERNVDSGIGKPHDVLIAGAIAAALGASLVDRETGAQIFPLSRALIEKAQARERVLFLIRRVA